MRPTQRVSEIIGQWTMTKPMWAARILLSKDTTWPDYVFYDALRRGRAPGYEIGGLFATPIAQTIASYAFGKGIKASLMPSSSVSEPSLGVSEDGKRTKDLKMATSTGKGAPGKELVGPEPAKKSAITGSPYDYTNLQLRRMMEREQAFFVNTTIDMYCLGEQYIFINPDCTFSVASPDTVNVEYSASDYRQILKVIVKTKYTGAICTDEYTADTRTVRITYSDGRAPVVQEYANLIGRIPMVHFANERGPNEIHGRVLYEAALPIMRRYDDLMYKTTDGVELLGNPIPAFVGLDNPAETLALNSTQETYQDENGDWQTRNLLRFDRNLGLVLGKGGDVKMVAPPVGFTKDSLDTLRQLFLLLLNHTRIPEYAWGGAISSSKASAETQAPPFIKYIEFRRLLLEGVGADPALGIEARGGFLELIDIWLRTYQLLNPEIVVGPVHIDWPEIDAGDAEIKYKWGTFFRSVGDITSEDAVAMSGYWDDAAAVVARATGEPERLPQYDEYDKKLKAARLAAAQASTEPSNNNGRPFTTDYTTILPDGAIPVTDALTYPGQYSITGPQVWQNEASY